MPPESAGVGWSRARPEGDWTRAEAESVWGAYLHARGRYREAEAVLVASHDVIRGVKGDEDIAARMALERVLAVREPSAAR